MEQLVQPICKVSNCSGEILSRGFCNRHYLQFSNGYLSFCGKRLKDVQERLLRKVGKYPANAICKMADCDGKARGHYFCSAHYDQYKRGRIDIDGNVLREKRHPAHRHINNGGYALVHAPEHPYASSKGYVMEHRLVLEKVIGRYLSAEESVHHKDGNKLNNAPENLELRTTRSHGEGYEWTTQEVIKGLSALKHLDPSGYRLVLEEFRLNERED